MGDAGEPAACRIVGEGGGDVIGVADQLRLSARVVADVGDDAGDGDQPARAVVLQRGGQARLSDLRRSYTDSAFLYFAQPILADISAILTFHNPAGFA